MNKRTTDSIKSLLCIAASFSFAGLVLADAPITGEVHANSTFADSPEDLKKAYDLLFEGDTQSLLQMTNEDKCAPVAKPIKVTVDELKGDYIRWHLAGHADLPCYSRPKDITIYINGVKGN
jgi:hypothetical protein